MKPVSPWILAVLVTLFCAIVPVSKADEPAPLEESTASSNGPCGQFDPDCRKRLARILTGVHFGQVQVEGGIRYGQGGADGAVRFNVTGASIDVPIGDLDVLTFDAIYVPDAGGFRIRFALAQSEVLFFCKDEEGNTHPPLVGIAQNCQPEGMIGIGGSILENQRDGDTGRWAARWAELNFVLNFLRNGNSLEYLHRRLNLFLGASVDTVFPGSTPGAGGTETMPRLNMGISGMLRTQNNRWEIRGYAGYRPNVIAWDDWAVEARAQVMYHLLLSRNIMATIGLDTQYSHWSRPWHSMGPFASDRDRDSVFVGLLFGVTFQ
jgi:hypothetical protein